MKKIYEKPEFEIIDLSTRKITMDSSSINQNDLFEEYSTDID